MQDEEQEKLPPHDLTAEQAVLGSILVSNGVLSEFSQLLKPKDFFRKAHRKIYEAMFEMHEAQVPVDIVTLSAKLQELNLLDKVGGRLYITDLALAIATTSNAKHYATIVKDCALRRGALWLADKLTNDFSDLTPKELSEEISSFQQKLEARVDTKERLEPLKPIIDRALARVVELQTTQALPGITTGFKHLDDITAGFQPGELVVLAGDTGMGKTTLLLKILLNAAINGVRVALFSLEMMKEESIMKVLAAHSGIDLIKIRRGWLDVEEIRILRAAAKEIEELPFYIADLDEDAFTLEGMIAALDRLAASGFDPELIGLDYLQQVESKSKVENRTLEVSKVSRGLKRYAMARKKAVLALSQLSRALKVRQEKRPQLSDLRESGSIEQDSSIVMFVFREAYYNTESTKKGSAEIIVAKNRMGETATFEIGYIGATSQFFDYNEGPRRPYYPDHSDPTDPESPLLEVAPPVEPEPEDKIEFTEKGRTVKEVWTMDRAKEILKPFIEKYGEDKALACISNRIAATPYISDEETEHMLACYAVAELAFLEMCPPKQEAPPPPPPKKSWRDKFTDKKGEDDQENNKETTDATAAQTDEIRD